MNEEVLLEKIDNLTTKVDEGFKGVHARQDLANGKLTKHEGLITKLEKADIKMGAELKAGAVQRKSGRGTWIAFTTLISIVLLLLGRYVY